MYEATTGEDGIATLNPKLYKDSLTYSIKEKQAPTGYKKNEEGWSLRIADYAKQQDFDGTILLELENKPYKGRVIVSKYDEKTKKKLPGIGFELLDQDGRMVQEGITNDAGYFEFKDLDLGTYTLRG